MTPAANTALQTIGVLANLEKTGVNEAFQQISSWAERLDCKIVSNFTAHHNGPNMVNPFGVDADGLREMFATVDLLISLGGDGTLLFAAQLVASAGIRVLSVNLGSLGFHTQVSPDNLVECLNQLATGDVVVENRMMLQVERMGPEGTIGPVLALNDVVVSKNAWGHMVTLRVSIDGEIVTDVAADALIMSSPTGSSAYNYAAGGPVLYPAMDAIILNALCTHRMQVSPLVLPASVELKIDLRPRRPDESAQVLTDGQPWIAIGEAETLKISRADVYLRLIVFENDFYGKLRDKLRWGGLF